MITRPQTFQDHSARFDERRHFILAVTASDSNTWMFSDTNMDLTDGLVFDVALSVQEINEQSSVWDEAVTYPQAIADAANHKFTTFTDDSQISVSDIVGKAAGNTAKIYLATGPVTALADCLLVFDGVLRSEITFTNTQITFDLVDARALEHRQLPQVLASTAFPNSEAAQKQRTLPVIYGSFTRGDGLDGGLALPEPNEGDKWIVASHPLKSWSRIWLNHPKVGDFIELIEAVNTTLTTNPPAGSTTIVVADRTNLKSGDQVIINKGGSTEEIVTLGYGYGSPGAQFNVESPFTQFAHNSGETVGFAYINKSDGGYATMNIKRIVKTLTEDNIIRKTEAIDAYIYIRPTGQSQAPIFANHPNRKTFVNATSTGGTSSLFVDNTTGYVKNQSVRIHRGGVREEVVTISSIVSETEFALTGTLTFTHSATDGDSVEPDELNDAENITGFNNVMDYNADSYVSIKTSNVTSGGAGVGNLTLEFPDLSTGDSNIDNDIGFIQDYDVQLKCDSAPGVTWSANGTCELRLGRPAQGYPADGALARMTSMTFIPSNSYQTLNLGANESSILLKAGPLATDIQGSATETAGSTVIDASGGDSTKFAAIGQRVIPGIGSASEERIVEITGVDDGVSFTIANGLEQTQSSIDAYQIQEAVGVFFALRSGDRGHQTGAHIILRFVVPSSHAAIGTEIARLFDLRFRFKVSVFNKIFATGNLVFVPANERPKIDPSIIIGGGGKSFIPGVETGVS